MKSHQYVLIMQLLCKYCSKSVINGNYANTPYLPGYKSCHLNAIDSRRHLNHVANFPNNLAGGHCPANDGQVLVDWNGVSVKSVMSCENGH